MSTGKKIFAVAPMMEWTDRHFRFLARLMSRHTYLYTEMITCNALVHGDRQRWVRGQAWYLDPRGRVHLRVEGLKLTGATLLKEEDHGLSGEGVS